MCMVRHSSVFAFSSVNLKEIRMIDEVQGGEAKACNPIGVLNGIGGWQEAYIGRLNKEYIELLSGDGSEADKFWELCKRIREDRRCAGVQISMRGSDPLPIICRMINEGVITLGDLDEFSAELREAVATITEPHKDI